MRPKDSLLGARGRRRPAPASGANQSTTINRRDLLKRSGALAAGLLATGPVSTALASTTPSASASGRVSRPPSQPNILIIMTDQMRTPRWFAPGPAPDGLPLNIARIRQGGVSFARHYTASNDCTPSRAALVTGLHTHQTGAMITGKTTLDPAFPTWGRMLRDFGYQTYWYGKWHLTLGDTQWTTQSGPPGLERYGFGGGTFPSPNGAPGQGSHVDPYIANQFAHFYRSLSNDAPWCTTISFVNPHDIAWWYRYYSEHPVTELTAAGPVLKLPPNFETPAQLKAGHKPTLQRSLQETAAQGFGPVPFTGPNVERSWLPFLDLYVRLQQAVDAQIGLVLNTLAAKPQVAANTIIIFTSDHGEYGASHGMRGKGASVYEEAIRVPLIVNDPRGLLTAAPNQVRQQLTSSVDIAPMLLTIACGSNDWRSESRYQNLATRPDLTAILANPSAPGRAFALHATDEVVTEFAPQPYAANAPLHVVGLITPQAKYATYSHWKAGTMNEVAHGRQVELYDYSTQAGRQETLNLAGRSPLEQTLKTQLEHAVRTELRAPLSPALHSASVDGISNYLQWAQLEASVSHH
jgi:arylsulfatase A-like enzyme